MSRIASPRLTVAALLGCLVAGCASASSPSAAPAAATVAPPSGSSGPTATSGAMTPGPATSARPSPSPTTPLPSPGQAAAGVVFPTGRFASSPDQPIDLRPTGDAYIAGQFATAHDHYTVTGDQVSFRGESCGGATGVYSWSVSGGDLILKRLSDTCPDRVVRLVLPLVPAAVQLPYVSIASVSAHLDQPDYNQSTVDTSGSFYETDGSGGFYRYAADGSVTGSWPSALTYTVGIAVNAAGEVFVANFDDATIHVFDQSGKELRHWQVAGGSVGPVGLGLDPQGNLYVALHRVHPYYVERYAPGGTLLGRLVPRGSGPGEAIGQPSSGPEEVAVDRAGNVWLSDPENGRLVEVDARGRPLRTITGDGRRKLDHPGIVAVDPAGDVYTMQNREVWEFGPTGKLIGEWFSPYDANIVIDAAGHVFLVDQNIIAVQLPRG